MEWEIDFTVIFFRITSKVFDFFFFLKAVISLNYVIPSFVSLKQAPT